MNVGDSGRTGDREFKDWWHDRGVDEKLNDERRKSENDLDDDGFDSF